MSLNCLTKIPFDHLVLEPECCLFNPHAPNFPHAGIDGLWVNVGVLFLNLWRSPPPPPPPPLHQRIRVSPRTICLEMKRAQENIPPSAPPTAKLQLLENVAAESLLQQGYTQHPRVVPNNSSAPVTFAPPSPPPNSPILASWASSGR